MMARGDAAKLPNDLEMLWARGHLGAAMDTCLRLLAQHADDGAQRIPLAMDAADLALSLGLPSIGMQLISLVAQECTKSARRRDRPVFYASVVTLVRARTLMGHLEAAESELSTLGDIPRASAANRRRMHLAAVEVLARTGRLTTAACFFEELKRRSVRPTPAADLGRALVMYGRALADGGTRSEAIIACGKGAEMLQRFDPFVGRCATTMGPLPTPDRYEEVINGLAWAASRIVELSATVENDSSNTVLFAQAERAAALYRAFGCSLDAMAAYRTVSKIFYRSKRYADAARCATSVLNEVNDRLHGFMDGWTDGRRYELLREASKTGLDAALAIGDDRQEAFFRQVTSTSWLGPAADASRLADEAVELVDRLSSHDAIFQPTKLRTLWTVATNFGELQHAEQGLRAADRLVAEYRREAEGGDADERMNLADAYEQRSRCLEEVDRDGEAIDSLREAISIREKARPKRSIPAEPDPPYQRIIYLLARAGNWQEACAYATRAAGDASSSPANRRLAALQWIERQATYRARQDVALDTRFERIEILRYLAVRDERHRGDLIDLLVQVGGEQLVDRALPARELLDEAVKIARLPAEDQAERSARLGQTLERVGVIYRSIDAFDAARPFLAEAVRLWKELAADDPPAHRERLAYVFEEMCVLLERSGADAETLEAVVLEAVECHRLLVGDDHRSRDVFIHAIRRAADRLADLGRWSLSSTVLTDAVDVIGAARVEASPLLQDRAWVNLRVGRLTAAERDLDAAAELEPGNARVYLTRGMIHDHAGREDKAIRDFSRAIDLRPGYFAALSRRGAVYFALGRYDEALADLDAALNMTPGNAHARWLRGRTFLSLGRVDDATTELLRAVTLSPETSWHRYQFALALHVANRVEEREENLREAVRQAELELTDLTKNDLAVSVFNLSIYHAALDSPDESLRYCDEALSQEPLPDVLTEVRMDISELSRMMPSRANICCSLLAKISSGHS
jgi:tetratricopeptide (TPR) repeat protein